MKFTPLEIEGLFIIEPETHTDRRGYFMESYSTRKFEECLPGISFVQDNEVYSQYGVIRGLHYQKPPYAQAKLVRAVTGEILDVAVDLRPGSPTFGRYAAVELSATNKRQLFIPRGFAHGYSVLSADALVQYKCDNYYNPTHEGTIIWNDINLNIDWRIPSEKVILSERDSRNEMFSAKGYPFI